MFGQWRSLSTCLTWFLGIIGRVVDDLPKPQTKKMLDGLPASWPSSCSRDLCISRGTDCAAHPRNPRHSTATSCSGLRITMPVLNRQPPADLRVCVMNVGRGEKTRLPTSEECSRTHPRDNAEQPQLQRSCACQREFRQCPILSAPWRGAFAYDSFLCSF